MPIWASPPMTDCISCTPLRKTTGLVSSPSREKYPECSATKVGSMSGESWSAIVKRAFCACKSGAPAKKKQSEKQKEARTLFIGSSPHLFIRKHQLLSNIES